MPASHAASPATLGVILAGGLARRMGGGDKPLRLLAGRPLLAHAAERLRPQVTDLALNANGEPSRFSAFSLPVVADSVPGHPGPLAGILAALDWAASAHPSVDWVVTVPGDTPFIPHDLVARLHTAREAAGVPVACARSGEWAHPPVALWPVSLRGALRQAILAGEGRIRRWAAGHGCAEAEWPALPLDPFFNANTPDELAEAEALLRRSAP